MRVTPVGRGVGDGWCETPPLAGEAERTAAAGTRVLAAWIGLVLVRDVS